MVKEQDLFIILALLLSQSNEKPLIVFWSIQSLKNERKQQKIRSRFIIQIISHTHIVIRVGALPIKVARDDTNSRNSYEIPRKSFFVSLHAHGHRVA